jgi:TolA-binding protein
MAIAAPSALAAQMQPPAGASALAAPAFGATQLPPLFGSAQPAPAPASAPWPYAGHATKAPVPAAPVDPAKVDTAELPAVTAALATSAAAAGAPPTRHVPLSPAIAFGLEAAQAPDQTYLDQDAPVATKGRPLLLIIAAVAIAAVAGAAGLVITMRGRGGQPPPAAPGVAAGTTASPAPPAEPKPEPAPQPSTELPRKAEPPPAPDAAPRDDDPRLAHAQDLLDAGKARVAIAELRRYLEDHDGSARAHLLLGTAYFVATQNPSAVTHLKRAITLDPKNGQALVTLGNVYQAMGDATKAREAYRSYLSVEPRGKFAADVKAILEQLR